MNAAFLPHASPLPLPLPLHHTRLPTCARRPRRRVHFRPTSLAKYQQQETNESPESETPLEEIVPPPALPTLTTLTGQSQKKQQLPIDQPQPEFDLSELSSQGPALSKEHENAISAFLKGVVEEFRMIEWPSFDRVVRLTVIILITIVFAVAGLYFVDGFFYRMASIVFEGKI